jgi:hypothetical protein
MSLPPDVAAALTERFSIEHAALVAGESFEAAQAKGDAFMQDKPGYIPPDRPKAAGEQQPTALAQRQAAAARIEELIADKDFGKRLLGGDHKAVTEWRELHETGGAEALMAVQEFKRDEKVIAHFADRHGLSAELVAELREFKPVAPEIYREAVAWVDRQSRDREFAKKYLAGDPEAGRLMFLANSLIARGPAAAEG